MDMDIAAAASHGWNREAYITIVLEDLTIEEFEKHAFLDNHLSGISNRTTIYSQRKRKESEFYHELTVYHGQNEDEPSPSVSISIDSRFKRNRKFIYAMAERFGSSKKDVTLASHLPLIDGVISGNLWNGADKIGHKEIAELARYFDEEFVKKNGFVTRIGTSYEKLKPEDILKMEYRPECVVEFELITR
jgi:hypothetical protein